MEADGIKEVEVSNQNRLAFENENKFLYPYLAQAQIGDKKHKFLLYATGLENSCSILKDYIELKLYVRIHLDNGQGVRFLRDSY